MNAKVNFIIRKAGMNGKRETFEAVKPDGTFIASISPLHLGEYMREYHETRMVILWPNGKVMNAEDIEHASDIIGESMH